ncbi:MAG: universal stress protein [Ktedonobacterales bacterium]
MSTASTPAPAVVSPVTSLFKRVFVPLDGSRRAEQSVCVAARLARASQGTVILAQVIHFPYEYSMTPFTYSVSEGTYEREWLDASAYLRQIADLPALSGIPTERLVLDGVVGPVLLDTIETSRADCVVITTHGRTGVSRWALGSMAEQLARSSSVPTLVLPDGLDPFEELIPAQPGDTVQPRLRILTPLDGSAMAEAALEPAARLLTALAATQAAESATSVSPVGEIHLLMALAPGFMTAETTPETMICEGARAYLTKVASELHAQFPLVNVTWSLASTTEAPEGIAEAAGATVDHSAPEYAGYAAIVMASHGRTGFARWALGSVAERVLRLTKRPLLIVRPLAKRAHRDATKPLNRTAPLTHEKELAHAVPAGSQDAESERETFGVPFF